jgi:hypothetical protein
VRITEEICSKNLLEKFYAPFSGVFAPICVCFAPIFGFYASKKLLYAPFSQSCHKVFA